MQTPNRKTTKQRLTAELIQHSLSYLNPLKERELDLRGEFFYTLKRTWYYTWAPLISNFFCSYSGNAGHKIPAIENLGVAKVCANLPPHPFLPPEVSLSLHTKTLPGCWPKGWEWGLTLEFFLSFLGPRCNWFHRQRYQHTRQLPLVTAAPDPLVGTKSDKQHPAYDCELYSESENTRPDFQ